MVWQCLANRLYWETVITDLNELFDWSLQLDPHLPLLGIMKDIVASRHKTLCLFFTLYYARREILLRWQPNPPTFTGCVSAVNAVLSLYKLTYDSRNGPKKFDNVWSTWIDAHCPAEPLHG